MMQKPRDRRLADRDLLLCQSGLEFRQRDVRLLHHQLPDQILVRRQREILVAAKLGRADAARFAVKPEEAADRADAHVALLRSFRNGGATLVSTQILRKWLRHPCWPPPSRKLESYPPPDGNPPTLPFRETL